MPETKYVCTLYRLLNSYVASDGPKVHSCLKVEYNFYSNIMLKITQLVTRAKVGQITYSPVLYGDNHQKEWNLCTLK